MIVGASAAGQRSPVWCAARSPVTALAHVPPPDLAPLAGHGLRGWAFRHCGLDPGQASLPSQMP
jgi:hypothetical protein